MNFREFVSFLTRIEQEASRNAMTNVLAQLFKGLDPEEARVASYLVLGSLRAPYENVQFGFSRKTIEKVLANLLDRDAATIKSLAHEYGDYGLVAEKDAPWGKPEKELSLLEVYARLCTLTTIAGVGSQEKKQTFLADLLQAVSPEEAKFIIRIVLGKLRLGFSEMTLVDAFSWMIVGDKSLKGSIEDAYNKCADIGLIAYTLKKFGLDGLETIHITLGIPIRPAAAERMPTAEDIFQKLGTCVAQPKLDGFRLQVHIDKTGEKPKVWFFSRNLLTMSDMFPDLAQAVEKLPVTSAILEGEALVFDESTGSYVPFQETVKRKRKHGVQEAAQEMPLRLVVFDLLFLNGVALLSDEHAVRRVMAKKIIEQMPACDVCDRVVLVQERTITSAQQLKDYFKESITDGLEGLVAKRPDAIYRPGKRNFNWIKYKRQEEGHLEDTIDVVVLGYYYGHGRRAAFGIGAFLVGVYDKECDCFKTVAKVGTGLSDADWIELKARCDAFARKTKPHDVDCSKELTPDVWVTPEIVCIIRADEITISPLHSAGKTDAGGFALRFPRFMGYRPDKSIREVTTVSELVTLFKHQKQR